MDHQGGGKVHSKMVYFISKNLIPLQLKASRLPIAVKKPDIDKAAVRELRIFKFRAKCERSNERIDAWN